MAAKSVMTSDASASFFTALPDDLLQRVLVGVPLDDHHAAAAACQAFHGVVNGPCFPALRQKYGFAERGIVTVTVAPGDVLDIQMAHKSGILASVPSSAMTGGSGGTSDGGNRLFVSNITHNATPNQVLTVDVPSRRWRRLAYLPQDRKEHCIEWHRGLLYVAGGMDQNRVRLRSFHAFNEATGIWEVLPPMPQPCMWPTSGIIDNQLLIADGRGMSTLQIYDIASRTWRRGASLPDSQYGSNDGFVVDGKLCLIHVNPNNSLLSGLLVYDPQANTWTKEETPSIKARVVCVHDGRLVAFQEDGTVVARATDGSWFPIAHVERQERSPYRSFSRSVLLG